MQYAIILYYDGNERKLGLGKSETPDSSAPHVWGLPAEYEINLAITGPMTLLSDIRSFGTLFVDEERVDEIKAVGYADKEE